jgi:hypothetical protein
MRATPKAAMRTGDPQFTEALGAFETALETPLVPGELEAWAHAVRASAANLEPLIERRIASAHREQLAEIERTDPELIRRVEILEKEDEQICRDLECLRTLVAELDAAAPSVGPNEEHLNDQVSRLVDQGLAWVIRVHKQEVALRTWLVEAFERDRGAVD